jgi:signal peptidase I
LGLSNVSSSFTSDGGGMKLKQKMRFVIRFSRMQLLLAAFSLVIIALAWVLFAPVQFGGQATYVIVNGNSMLPMLDKGDLVLLRQQPSYQVGDIVTYRYPGLGPVIHRIIAKDGQKFSLKGDNNTWIDGYQPKQSEILGKYWFELAGAGNSMAGLQKPWALSLASGLIIIFAGVSMFGLPSADRKKKFKRQMDGVLMRMGFRLARWQESYWYGLYALAFVAIILGIFAFTHPLQRNAQKDLLYSQSGIFTYSGNTSPDVYDNGRITTGDAIFPQINCAVNFTFDYNLKTAKPYTGMGSYNVVVKVGELNGWERQITLQPDKPFIGPNFNTKQTVDVCEVERLIKKMEARTGLENHQYYMAVLPQIKINGQVAGANLSETFAPPLSFNVEPAQIYLPTRTDVEKDPLQPLAAGALSVDTIEPNTFNIFSLPLPVATARTLSLGGIILAAAGMGLSVLIFKRAEINNEVLRARLLAGTMLIETERGLEAPGDQVIEMPELEDLLRLGERMGSSVFLQVKPFYADFMVREGNMLYRYRREVPLKPSKIEDLETDHLVEGLRR